MFFYASVAIIVGIIAIIYSILDLKNKNTKKNTPLNVSMIIYGLLMITSGIMGFVCKTWPEYVFILTYLGLSVIMVILFKLLKNK